MANTVIVTNRTIEVSDIDSDYMMPIKINVQSVIFIPGVAFKTTDYVHIIEDNPYGTNPFKILLISSIGQIEPRVWVFNQRLRLGFTKLGNVFNTGAKVIFNIGEIHFGNDAFNTQMKMQLSAENEVL
jgi:hypothetical protein